MKTLCIQVYALLYRLFTVDCTIIKKKMTTNTAVLITLQRLGFTLALDAAS